MGAGPSDDVPVFLETERLVLRRFTADDADDLLALDLDPLVRRYVEDGEPVTHEEAVSSIEHFLRYHERSEHFGFWVAVETESARFLGWFHFRPSPDDPPLEPELGYRLVSSAWGRGFATEGSRALIDHGFATSDIVRVYAQAMAVHTASRRVMEKSGMRLVRSFIAEWPVRIPGDEHGDVEYEITRADWEAAREHRGFGCPIGWYVRSMSNDQTSGRTSGASSASGGSGGSGGSTEPNEDAGVARDVLSVFNAEGVVDEPGRPSENDPEESLPSEADLPQPQ